MPTTHIHGYSDQISVTGYTDNNGRFVADTITVTRNVRG